MQGKGRGPSIQIQRGIGGPQGRIGPGGQGGPGQGRQGGFGQGFGNSNQSGALGQIRDRLPFLGGNGGSGDLSGFLPPEALERLRQIGPGGLDHGDFLSQICENLDMEDLPGNIIIRCETSGDAPVAPAVDDNAL
jgi:hypothetical protein